MADSYSVGYQDAFSVTGYENAFLELLHDSTILVTGSVNWQY